ncbi:MAG TPA: hypothetical protein VLI88_03405 [Patescibacteria group bacterium]|nr:hypothetical protein [Patescibacteria group bacterium]
MNRGVLTIRHPGDAYDPSAERPEWDIGEARDDDEKRARFIRRYGLLTEPTEAGRTVRLYEDVGERASEARDLMSLYADLLAGRAPKWDRATPGASAIERRDQAQTEIIEMLNGWTQGVLYSVESGFHPGQFVRVLTCPTLLNYIGVRLGEVVVSQQPIRVCVGKRCNTYFIPRRSDRYWHDDSCRERHRAIARKEKKSFEDLHWPFPNPRKEKAK